MAAKTPKPEQTQSLLNVLQEFLTKESAGTQEEICLNLQKQGYKVNQTKVSRLLRKLGAVKVKDERGEIVYWLPKEPPPPEMSSPLSSLVIDIIANETLVMIHTCPGSASLVARLLDYQFRKTTILGTIAGDDTIFVMPKSIKQINTTLKEVKILLQK
jgi:transcriptional regulator of arginine metabolism